MLATNLIPTLFLALTSTTFAFPTIHQLQPGEYSPPLSTDFRSPCPGLNIISNLGLVPRDGRGLTLQNVPKSFLELMNVDPQLSILLMNGALAADNDPIRTFGVRTPSTPEGILNLNDTVKHGRTEHDASLSRPDFPGIQDKPDFELVVDIVTRASDCKFLTIADMARLRVDRFNFSKKNNPSFTYTLPKEDFLAYSEAALMMLLLGGEELKVPVEFLMDFFLREKMPEGWRRPENPITYGMVAGLADRLRKMGAEIDTSVEVPRCTSIKVE
ncbi:hypothetical protein HDV05_005129 [Chytridiales sp. JEL 0842]|nr:hypothetical protein HDV05_005129 [Chytridiales sp. JEL 0842]